MANLFKIILISVMFFVTGCGYSYQKQNITSEVMFSEAIYALKTGKTNKAINLLQKIEVNYPYEDNAINAQVFLIWIYYQKNDLVSAEGIIDSFLKYYPYNQYSPWVEYMKAIITFEQIPNYKRNTVNAEEAIKLFKTIVQKYPDTEYAKDVKFKEVFVKEILAAKVMEIGNYYLKHKAYIGAIYRYQEILNSYSDTIFVPEALYRLSYAYLSMGIDYEANVNLKVLQYNYPNNTWTKKTQNLVKKYTKNQKKR